MARPQKMKVRSTKKIRILIADDDRSLARRTHDFLIQNGFDCRVSFAGNDTKKIISSWKPKIVLVDLLLPETNAFEILRFCQNEPALRDQEIKVMVLSGHNNEENVREAFQRGASDFIARPIVYTELLNRIVFQLREQRSVRKENQTATLGSIHLADLALSYARQKTTTEEVLYNLCAMTAKKVGGLRCSIIQNVGSHRGIVLSANDRKDIAGLSLDLKKYPEIQLVVNTGKIVVIDNLEQSRTLSKIKKEFKEIHFNSMIVCPLYYHHKMFGVISLRMPTEKLKASDDEIVFMEYMAKVISLYLSTQSAETFGKYGLIQVPA